MIAGIIEVCIASVYEHLYLVGREKNFGGANENLLGVGVYWESDYFWWGDERATSFWQKKF